jgi:hypothetical protein
MSSREEISVPEQNIAGARALEVFNDLIKDADRRARYADAGGREGRQKVFDEWRDTPDNDLADVLRRAGYTDIPEDALVALESLSVEQLEAIAILDAAFVPAGLFVEVPGSPGNLFYN